MMRIWLALTVTVLTALPCVAQDTPRPADPAKANNAEVDKLIDRLITSSGGAEALGKIKNRVAEGTLEAPAQNIKGTIKTVSVDPTHSSSSQDIPGFGSEKRTVAGNIGWHLSAAGPRLQTQEELDQAVRMAHFDHPLLLKKHWRKLYASIALKKGQEFKGKNCTRLECTPPAGKDGKKSPAEVIWISEETGLMAGMEIETTSPMGTLKLIFTIRDYRDVDGVKVAFAADQEIVGMPFKASITTTKVEQNVELPPETFAVPPEVQKLIDRKKEKEAEKKAKEEAGG